MQQHSQVIMMCSFLIYLQLGMNNSIFSNFPNISFTKSDKCCRDMLPLGEDLSFQSIHHVVHILPRTPWTQCGKKQAELPCLVVDPCQTKPGKI